MPTLRVPLPSSVRLVLCLAAAGCATGKPQETLPPPLPRLPPLPLPAALVGSSAQLRAAFAAVGYGTTADRARASALPAPAGRRARVSAQPADVPRNANGGVDPARGFVMARLVNQEAYAYRPLGLGPRETVWVYADSVAQGWRATLVSLRAERPAFWQIPLRREFHREHVQSDSLTRFRYFLAVPLARIPRNRFAPSPEPQPLQAEVAAFSWVTNCAGSPGSCCSSYAELQANAPFVFADGTPAPPPE